MRPTRFAIVATAGILLLAACRSSGTPKGSDTTTKGSGPVDVLYAGSLLDLMENVVGPQFHAATGFTFDGMAGDSGSLASEIKGKSQQGDAFISANPSKDVLLEGAANGNWVSWYATFATSPLVIGYNTHSKFAHELQTEPWYQVVARPGFLLGRTDPTTDPKGVLAVKALDTAATTYNEPALQHLATEPSDVYAENTLVGHLQAGQLDAGFFYGVEAATANIPTVPIPGSTLSASYTITVLNNAPHLAGADAFVTYLLGSAGRAALAKEGITLPTLVVSGTAPSNLQAVLSGQ